MMNAIRRISSDKNGNFAMIAAISAFPIFIAAGICVDVGYAYSSKVKLDNAADAAVLASLQNALSDLQKTGLAKTSFTQDEEVGVNFMRGNLEDNPDIILGGFQVEVKQDVDALYATGTYEADVNTSIMNIFGNKTVRISNTVTATTKVGKELNFFMLLDNTPSMGVAATLQDIAKLETVTQQEGVGLCAFACHLSGNYGAEPATRADNFLIARDENINLRIDTVRQSTSQFMQELEGRSMYRGQMKAAIYTFGTDAETDFGLKEVAALSNDFQSLRSKTDGIELMTIPYQNFDDDRQTDYDKTTKKLVQEVDKAPKADANRENVIFMVTDGVNDSNKTNCGKKKVNAGRCIEPLDVKLCERFKSKGNKIAILYTTYLPIPNNGFYQKFVAPFQNDIPDELRQCASEGLFAEVGFGDSLPEAMKEMLNTILMKPRLTH